MRRVAVTGVGVVANCGIGKDAFWNGLLSGVPEHGFDVVDFDPAPYFDNPKEAPRVVIFSERIPTLALLEKELAKQLGVLLEN